MLQTKTSLYSTYWAVWRVTQNHLHINSSCRSSYKSICLWSLSRQKIRPATANTPYISGQGLFTFRLYETLPNNYLRHFHASVVVKSSWAMYLVFFLGKYLLRSQWGGVWVKLVLEPRAQMWRGLGLPEVEKSGLVNLLLSHTVKSWLRI